MKRELVVLLIGVRWVIVVAWIRGIVLASTLVGMGITMGEGPWEVISTPLVKTVSTVRGWG